QTYAWRGNSPITATFSPKGGARRCAPPSEANGTGSRGVGYTMSKIACPPLGKRNKYRNKDGTKSMQIARERAMPTERIAPPKPMSSHALAWTEWSDVPRFALRYRALSLAAIGEDYHVGVAIEELPPGKQSAPAHYHI